MFSSRLFIFLNDTATTEIYTLSLHDALPIFGEVVLQRAAVDGPLSAARHQPHPGHGLFAPAGRPGRSHYRWPPGRALRDLRCRLGAIGDLQIGRASCRERV